MQQIIVLIHVVAAVVFIAAHAVNAVAIFQVRAESDRAKLTAILNRSASALLIATIAVIVVLISGIVAGIIGSSWGRFWIWVALVLLVVVGSAMTPFAAVPMNGVRTALGIQKVKAGEAAPVALGDSELAAARAALRPELVAGFGAAGLLVIIWLMLAKPF